MRIDPPARDIQQASFPGMPMIHALIAAALATPTADPGGGGPHARHRELFGAAGPAPLPAPGPMNAPSWGPDARVYGYLAYWDADLDQVPWDELTDIAMFSADVDPAGNLSNTGRWSQTQAAIAMAAPYGVRVHLCVTNFTTSQLDTLLGSPTARANLVSQLQTWVANTGAHGVNIDFEGMPAARRAEMVQFTGELAAVFDDVVLATPAVDWSNAWDYAGLTQHADLFIMGYDYHWSGSSRSGPTDPLYSGAGTVFTGEHALDWTVSDYLAEGADPSRVILGLPLYGRSYFTADNSVPSDSQGNAGTILWADGQAEIAQHAAALEPGVRSRYYRVDGAQHWMNDVETLRERVQYALGEGLAGIGFWALNYDDEDAALWAMIRQETTWTSPPVDPPDDPPIEDPPVDDPEPPPPVDPGFQAVGGQPLLAYVGDTVVLTGAGSRGPEGVALVWQWTQVSGPPVDLDDADTENPRFVVREPGSHVFALRVGDGEVASAPARSHVVAIDPGADAVVSAAGCGCSGGLPASGWLAALGGLLLVRRRR